MELNEKEILQCLVNNEYKRVYFIDLNEDTYIIYKDNSSILSDFSKKKFSSFYESFIPRFAAKKNVTKWLLPFEELKKCKQKEYPPRIVTKEVDGETIYLEYRMIPLEFNSDETLSKYILTVRDVSSNINEYNNLQFLHLDNRKIREAYMDSLTNIFTSNYLRSTMNILKERDELDLYSLVLVNVCNFKLINEYFGSKTADKLLRDIASTLLSLKRDKNAIVTHHYADIFLVLTKLPIEEIQRKNEELNFIMSKHPLPIRISLKFGVCPIEKGLTEFDEIYLRAKLACDKIKEENQVTALYDTALKNRVIRKQQVLSCFHKAIRKKEFVVYYQPIYSAKDDSITHAEALVRWDSPELGFISPGEFIPLLEGNGLITELDYYVLRRVFDDIRKSEKTGIDFPYISVNFSRNDFYTSDFFERIQAEFKLAKIPFSKIHLEVTETAFIPDKKVLIQLIKEMNQSGFDFWMDDFGSEYSTLNALKDFDVSTIKLDLKFFEGFEDNKKSRNIVLSVIDMAKRLNINVLAEGIETQEQLQFLKAVDCDYIQGYIYSKPVPYHDFQLILKENKRKPLFVS